MLTKGSKLRVDGLPVDYVRRAESTKVECMRTERFSYGWRGGMLLDTENMRRLLVGRISYHQ